MRIAVVIVNFRTPRLVLECLEALAADRPSLPDMRVIVVDNASGDDSVPLLNAGLATEAFRDWVEFMPLALNGGFGWGNNQAILRAMQHAQQPDAVVLLNPDARVERGAIPALVADLANRPRAGAIGCQLLDESGEPTGSAFRFPTAPREFIRGLGIPRIGTWLGIPPGLIPFGERGPVDWVTGACVILRVAALRDTGLFDTGFFLYFEEVELMHRLRSRGWLCFHCPECRVIHRGGASTGVSFGELQSTRPPPAYVFSSRRRFFALRQHRRAALIANLAWLAGDVLGRIVALVAPARRVLDNSLERTALLKAGLAASRREATPAVATLDDQPGLPPAWQTR